MTDEHPKWQAYTWPEYDAVMTLRCGELLADILSSKSARTQILIDPKSLHTRLYKDFTPPGYEEYAGTYRGTPNSSLEERGSHAPSVLGEGDYGFIGPEHVNAWMEELLKCVQYFLNDDEGDHTANLIALAFIFARLGKTHPFLDGNGHVQRAVFAAMATEFGYPLSSRFTIHPRPFDLLLCMPLEVFTLAGPADESRPLVAIAEYLSFFLDGPFTAPGMNLMPEPEA